MLNWRNVRLIFLREVRDQLRDRRTLFMVAVLPLLLYPAMGIGMMELNLLFREQPRTVVVLGADQLPESPALLDGNRFDSRWFTKPSAAERLIVVSDSPESAEQKSGAARARREQLLEQARAVRDELPRDRERAGALFGKGDIEVLIVVPSGFAAQLGRVEQSLREGRDERRLSREYVRPEIVYNKADEKSQITYGSVTGALEKWETAILDDWLALARLDPQFTHPVLGEAIDVALAEQVSASIWARLFPALLVIMSITGAFYPAIDLVAGEKERGTMETLLICPASRSEIVLGKFFTVMAFSCGTALLNLASMGFTGKHIASMAPTGAMHGAVVTLPPLGGLLWLIVLLVPLAALFSALCLALATFARSSKEGQYYLTPLLMVTLGLTVFCLSPGVELNPRYALMPIVGLALLLKGLLLSPLQSMSLYAYIPAVLISSLGYSALALWWAVDQFQREEVLFREAERFDLKLWFKHLLRSKEPVPSFSEAAFCFVLIVFLQFFSMKFMHQKLEASVANRSAISLHLLLVQQLALIACPALMMGIMLTTSLRATFSIRWPQWKFLGIAALLPLAIHPLSYELLSRLRWFLGDLPPEMAKDLEFLSDVDQPMWLILLATSIAPAFCEEVAFRGFILRGLSRGGRTLLAIAFSSLAFGIMHWIPQQVFNASLIGILLAALTIRSRSLLPAMIFHFLNNGLSVVRARVLAVWGTDLTDNLFVARDAEGEWRYTWVTLGVCLVIALPLLRWLVRPLLPSRNASESGSKASPALPLLPVSGPVVPKGA